jgi:hypothetical protein
LPAKNSAFCLIVACYQMVFSSHQLLQLIIWQGFGGPLVNVAYYR